MSEVRFWSHLGMNMAVDKEGQWVKRAAYDAETARADRAEAAAKHEYEMRQLEQEGRKQAEAGCAALADLVCEAGPLHWAFHKYEDVAESAQAWEKKADALLKDNPGSRYLELAQIVEGLPKYDKVESETMSAGSHALHYVVVHKGNACWSIGKFESPEEADALARLLAWSRYR